MREHGKTGCGINDCRGSRDYHHVAAPRRALRGVPDIPRQIFAEPDDTGPGQRSALTAERSRDFDATINPLATAFGAAHGPNAAVHLEDGFAARPVMQSIHVLRREGKVRNLLLEACKRVMTGVRLSLSDDAPPPGIPFPNQGRIARERLRPCKIFSSKLFP